MQQRATPMPDPSKPGVLHNPGRMETLGDKLANIGAAEAQQRRQQETALHEAAQAAEQQRKEQQRSSIEDWKRDAAMAIESGKRPSVLPVPTLMAGREGFPISNSRNRDHGLFLDLQQWAAS